MAPNSRTSSRRFPHAEQGFSLLELLVVAAIGILLSTSFFGYNARSSQKSKLTDCANQLRFVHSALQLYATDHQGQYPATNKAATSEEPLSLLIPTATTRTELFICPATRDTALPEAKPFATRKISYAYLMGLTNSFDSAQWIMADALLTNGPVKTGGFLFSPNGKGTGRNHRQLGGNILFLDGHVDRSTSQAAFDFLQPPGTRILNPKN